MDTEKTCSVCHQPKPLDAFSPSAKGKFNRRADCKVCASARQRAHNAKVKADRLAYQADSARIASDALEMEVEVQVVQDEVAFYGATKAQQEAILAAGQEIAPCRCPQRGLCAHCGAVTDDDDHCRCCRLPVSRYVAHKTDCGLGNAVVIAPSSSLGGREYRYYAMKHGY